MAREKGMGNLQQEHNGKWTMRFCINGERISRSARTCDKQIAENLLSRILSPTGRGSNYVPLSETWHYYLVSPKRRDLAKATIESKRNIWTHFTKWINVWHPEVTQIAHITSDIIAEYLSESSIETTACTYNNRICVLREISHILLDKVGVTDDPWSGVKLRANDSHTRRELAIDEIKMLIVMATKKGCEWRLLFLIGLYTGLRLGDCCLLKWSDVFSESNIIQLIPSKTRKHSRGMPVTIPIHPTLADALTKMKSCNFNSEYVLPIISEMYTQKRWKVSEEIARIFKCAGVRMNIRIKGRKRLATDASFHSFRHTFVSFAVRAGVPLCIVQSIVGHTSSVMTRHYYHENKEALEKAVFSIPMV